MSGQVTVTELVALIAARATEATGSRFVAGVAGPPASGKSTLAKDLVTRLGPRAAVLPMDGFHMDNAALQAMGLLHRKGAPETFDAQGFVDLVRRLKRDGVVPYPTFDRAADATVPQGGVIAAGTDIVIVEGNYLLLDTPPWDQLAAEFDLTVALQVSAPELEARLMARWRAHGLSEPQARARAHENDLPNARFVAQNARPADYILR